MYLYTVMYADLLPCNLQCITVYIPMYYHVHIPMYYHVYLCIAIYYYVLPCITQLCPCINMKPHISHYRVYPCIFVYTHLLPCMLMYYHGCPFIAMCTHLLYKLECFTRISTTEKNYITTREKLIIINYFSHVFEIANDQLLTRHSLYLEPQMNGNTLSFLKVN